MNGPDHYRAAEALLEVGEGFPAGAPVREEYAALAQVHATLALTAATAGVSVTDDWQAVIQ